MCVCVCGGGGEGGNSSYKPLIHLICSTISVLVTLSLLHFICLLPTFTVFLHVIHHSQTMCDPLVLQKSFMGGFNGIINAHNA